MLNETAGKNHIILMRKVGSAVDTDYVKPSARAFHYVIMRMECPPVIIAAIAKDLVQSSSDDRVVDSILNHA